MTVFDSLRWPVNAKELCEGSLLEDIPAYLRIKWWVAVMITYDDQYVYRGETVDDMRKWCKSLNKTRIERPVYMLREMIAKYRE